MQYKILCKDFEGLKWYDSENEIWILLDQPETPATFEEYGSDEFLSDNGLNDNYDVLIYDPLNEVSEVNIDVTPPKQTVTYTITSKMVVDDIVYDYESPQGLYDINFKMKRKRMNNNWVYTITTTLEKLSVTDRICTVYAANATSN